MLSCLPQYVASGCASGQCQPLADGPPFRTSKLWGTGLPVFGLTPEAKGHSVSRPALAGAAGGAQHPGRSGGRWGPMQPFPQWRPQPGHRWLLAPRKLFAQGRPRAFGTLCDRWTAGGVAHLPTLVGTLHGLSRDWRWCDGWPERPLLCCCCIEGSTISVDAQAARQHCIRPARCSWRRRLRSASSFRLPPWRQRPLLRALALRPTACAWVTALGRVPAQRRPPASRRHSATSWRSERSCRWAPAANGSPA